MPGFRAEQNLQMSHPRDWQDKQMPRSSAGAGGGGDGAQLKLTDALAIVVWLACYKRVATL